MEKEIRFLLQRHILKNSLDKVLKNSQQNPPTFCEESSYKIILNESTPIKCKLNFTKDKIKHLLKRGQNDPHQAQYTDFGKKKKER